MFSTLQHAEIDKGYRIGAPITTTPPRKATRCLHAVSRALVVAAQHSEKTCL
jgi:hypothetical protein